MRILSIVVFMSILTAAQTLPAPQFITDPKQVASRPNAQVERNLTIETIAGRISAIRFFFVKVLRRRPYQSIDLISPVDYGITR